MTEPRDPAGGARTDGAALPLPVLNRGKVRTVYAIEPDRFGRERVLIVASDRVSAFDVVLPTPIPGKGAALTRISAWWFGFVARRGLTQSHFLSADVRDIGDDRLDASRLDSIAGRATVALACSIIPVECVVRGYLEGSAWREYRERGSVCGVSLPGGLARCDKLPEPIFTPATKAATGHDENITFERASEIAGLETMTMLRDTSIAVYNAAAEHALGRGIIIADTKFEFGLLPEDVHRRGRAWTPAILCDEVLTPDSSRFWPADGYAPGRAQPSFDKQFVREYLQGLTDRGLWDKSPPGPELPADVVAGTRARYEQAERMLCVVGGAG